MSEENKGDGKAELSNPLIYRRDEASGELEEKDNVTARDIELLKDEHLVGENFNLDIGYFSPAFMEKRLEILREKYGDLTGELPIVYANCDGNRVLKVNEGPCLTILRGKGTHTKLFVTRPGVDGKTEIYIMDSHTNSYDQLIEDTYKDADKYTILYPDTEVSRQNRELGDNIRRALKDGDPRMGFMLSKIQENSLGIQKDDKHCASYSVHFADRLYRKIRKVKNSDSTKGVVECFNEVMADIGNNSYVTKASTLEENVTESRKMFSMPKEFWIYSGSEGDLDIMIRAEAKKQLLEEKKKIGEGNAVLTDDEIETKIGEIGVNMKRKLVPYKTKRKEEVKGVRAALEEKKAEELKALEELELAQNKKVYEANSACFRIEDESDNCYEELVKKRKEMEGLGTGNAKELMKLEIQRLEDRRSKIDENIAAAGAKITDEQCKLEVIRENIKLKKREIPTAKVEDKARAEYAIPHNWRMKELKSVAGKLWDAKKAQKDLQQGVNEAIIKIEAVTDRFRKAKEVHRDLQQKVNKEIESSVNKIFRGSVKSSDSPTPENPVNSINAPNTPAVPGGFPSSPGGEFARGG